jgi:hypothetical protein
MPVVAQSRPVKHLARSVANNLFLRVPKSPKILGFIWFLTNSLASCQSSVPSCHLLESGEGAGGGTIPPGEEVGTISGTIGMPQRTPKILKNLAFYDAINNL